MGWIHRFHRKGKHSGAGGHYLIIERHGPGDDFMIRHQLNGVLTHLRQAVDARGLDAPTDAELLERYVTGRDQAAFELLVWRHGSMVLNTCRRMLARPEDAEDAFQATFLALVRLAKKISRREAVAGWLHTVACRV